MYPNIWETKGRIKSIDVEALWATLDSIISEGENIFPKALDSVRWTLTTKDSNIKGSGTIDSLAPLKMEFVHGTHCCLHIKLFHKELTPNIGLEKRPDIYMELVIDRFCDELTVVIATIGQDKANRVLEQILAAAPITRALIANHHSYVEPFVNKLLEDYPDYERNVFLIMRYRDEAPFPSILSTLKDTCTAQGLTLLRADDREYTADLWDNVLTYMYACSSAIAVIDQINYREFNPNIAIEVGFIQALGKPLLLLKDQAINVMPTDVVGKIYRPFNTYDATTTIPPQVRKWIADYGLAHNGRNGA